MTSRGFAILAVLLVLGVAVAWLRLGKDRINPAIPAGPGIVTGDGNAGKSRNGEVPAPAAAAREGVSPASSPPPISPAGPGGLTSSVAPGTPLVRTGSTPGNPDIAALSAAAPSPASRPEPPSEGRADLESVRFMLRDFRTRMGENPVGSNAEIMRAVMGGNPAGARLGPPVGQSLNEAGELIDRWGTPYFFHQLSKDSMEIRSAGPDLRMWTADDLVTK